jgi:pimeloyl-ACP methyl ester carboxylesterase
VRFDGTNRRGESYIDPDCRTPGDEYLHFRFSQAARDIRATIDFLERSPVYNPSAIILATFSLAAIEGRHALAFSKRGSITGWVSAVGMVDLQSALRTISGGLDYAYGLMRGVHFGRHELVGVVADMDHTGLDAIAHRMVFLEDARREMAAIQVPVTWIHGRDDAWMDLERVRDVLSCGRTENRKLIEVPTGHQLRTSREALSTFQLIAEEISEMALGRRLHAPLPRFGELSRRTNAERERRPKGQVNLRGFWRDYLLGRDRRFGMQLLTATAAYRKMMKDQVAALDIKDGQRIADLGAGTGEFSLHLATNSIRPIGITIDEITYPKRSSEVRFVTQKSIAPMGCQSAGSWQTLTYPEEVRFR